MVQIVKLIVIKYYTPCCHVLPVRSECSPQHLSLQNFDNSSTDTESETREKGTHKVRRLYVLTFISFTIMSRNQMSKISLNAHLKKNEADISANKVSKFDVILTCIVVNMWK
jgi:hypothetical protein